MSKAKELGILEFPYYEYDFKGNITYEEYSDGFWVRNEFNSKGNKIFLEDSNGDWCIMDYDSNDNQIFYEESTGSGYFRDYEGVIVKNIVIDYKPCYLSYKRNLILNKLLNDKS